jgi:predicted RNA-binding protein
MANAYLKRSSENRLVLEDVATLRCERDELYLKPLFGDEKCIKGKVIEIDFIDSRILLEQESTEEGKRE